MSMAKFSDRFSLSGLRSLWGDDAAPSDAGTTAEGDSTPADADATGGDVAASDGGVVAGQAGGDTQTQTLQVPSGTQVGIEVPDGVDVDAEALDGDYGGNVVIMEGRANRDGSATVTPIADAQTADLSGRFQSWFDDYDRIQDDKIQKLRDNRVDYNDLVGDWILTNDDLIPGILNRQVGLVLGQEGLQVEPADPDSDADQKLAEHMEKIYAGDMDDEPRVKPANVVRRIFVQNYMAARSVLRAGDLAELPLDTVDYYRDPVSGDEFYVQDAVSFSRYEVDDDGDLDEVSEDVDEQVLRLGEHVFDATLFHEEPLRAIADTVVNKMVIQRLKARKAEIASVGGLFIKVNPPDWLPESEYTDRIEDPKNDGETITKLELHMREGVNKAFETLEDYQSGFIMSIPAHWEVDQITIPETGEPMDEQIRGYNKSIASRLLFPLDLVELREGAELSRDTLYATLLNTIAGWRNEILDVFDGFADVQKDIHGLSGDVNHAFPKLEAEDEALVLEALNFAGLAGMSTTEVRQALSAIEGVDLPDEPEGDPAGQDDLPPAGGPSDPQERTASMRDALQGPDAPDAPDDQQPPSPDGVEASAWAGASADIDLDGKAVDDLTDAHMDAMISDLEAAGVNLPGVDDPEVGFRTLPKGWDRSSVLKAWKSLGGTWTSCHAKMAPKKGERFAKRWCSALKDEVLGTENWRKGGKKGEGAGADPPTRTVSFSGSFSDFTDTVESVLRSNADRGVGRSVEADDHVVFTVPQPSGDDVDVVVTLTDDGEASVRSDEQGTSLLSGLSGEAADSSDSDPFANVPVIPAGTTHLTRELLEDWVAWKLAVRAGATDTDTDAEARDWNPALHPRGPDGKFISRPWSFNLPGEKIRGSSTFQLFDYLDANGEDVDAILSDPSIRIDGVPDSVTDMAGLRDHERELRLDDDSLPDPDAPNPLRDALDDVGDVEVDMIPWGASHLNTALNRMVYQEGRDDYEATRKAVNDQASPQFRGDDDRVNLSLTPDQRQKAITALEEYRESHQRVKDQGRTETLMIRDVDEELEQIDSALASLRAASAPTPGGDGDGGQRAGGGPLANVDERTANIVTDKISRLRESHDRYGDSDPSFHSVPVDFEADDFADADSLAKALIGITPGEDIGEERTAEFRDWATDHVDTLRDDYAKLQFASRLESFTRKSGSGGVCRWSPTDDGNPGFVTEIGMNPSASKSVFDHEVGHALVNATGIAWRSSGQKADAYNSGNKFPTYKKELARQDGGLIKPFMLSPSTDTGQYASEDIGLEWQEPPGFDVWRRDVETEVGGITRSVDPGDLTDVDDPADVAAGLERNDVITFPYKGDDVTLVVDDYKANRYDDGGHWVAGKTDKYSDVTLRVSPNGEIELDDERPVIQRVGKGIVSDADREGPDRVAIFSEPAADTPEERWKDYISAVNRSFYKMAVANTDLPRHEAERLHIKSAYSSTDAHETAAMVTELIHNIGDDPQTNYWGLIGLTRNHPHLLKAYLDVRSPPGDFTAAIDKAIDELSNLTSNGPRDEVTQALNVLKEQVKA